MEPISEPTHLKGEKPTTHPSSVFPDLLLDWISKEQEDLKILFLYGVAIGITLLIVPISVQSLVNTIAFGSILQPIFVLAFVVLGFLGLSGALRLSQLIVIERIQVRIFVRTALQTAIRLTDISFDELQRSRIGSLVNRFLEISSVQKAFAFLCLEAISLALQLITSLILLSIYHPIFLLFSILLIISIHFVVKMSLKSGLKSAKVESDAKYKLTDFLEELGENHLAYRSNRLFERVGARANALTQAYTDARVRHFATLKLLHASSFAIQAVFSALLLGLGGWLVVRNQLSLGQLIAGEIHISSLLFSLTKLGKLMENLFDLAASTSKIERLLSLQLERQDGLRFRFESGEQATNPAALTFQNVHFVQGTRFQLNDISLKIEPGESIAFSGGVGTGKSTLIELIYGLRNPLHGEIRIDGHPIRELDLSDLRSQIALVQGIQLIDGSVLENIQLDQETFNLAEIRALLVEFGLDQSISGLSDGLNTHLESTRPPFSKGQLQKLMIIRAIVQKPRLLLLDEALDAFDQETRTQVLDAILRRKNQFTLMMTTHSEELARRCDRTFILENGKLQPVLR